MLLSLLISTSNAGVFQASLSKGEPEFQEACLGKESCASNFYQFLTHSMMEQGLSMQSHTIVSTPLLASGEGIMVGAGVHSFPFSPPQKNLAGKEENTSFSPVFPGIEIAQVSSDKSYSLRMLPPIPVQGAAAFLVSGTISRLWQEGENWKRTLDTELGLVRAKAPITASDEQFAERDSLDYPDNLNEETFASNCSDGCLDTYYHASLEFRVGQSWQLNSVLSPYAQFGLNTVYENLFVEYDQTGWQLFSLQPMFRGGMGFTALDDSLTAMIGGMLTPQYPGQDRDGKMGFFYTTQAQFGYLF